MQCAQTIGTVASLRLGSNLTEDEVAYLALHVARVVADARKHVSMSSALKTCR